MTPALLAAMTNGDCAAVPVDLKSSLSFDGTIMPTMKIERTMEQINKLALKGTVGSICTYHKTALLERKFFLQRLEYSFEVTVFLPLQERNFRYRNKHILHSKM